MGILDAGERPRGYGELSAAEWYTLLCWPESGKSSQAFKLAMLELVARRVLEVAQADTADRPGRPVTALFWGTESTDNRVLLSALSSLDQCEVSTFSDGRMGLVAGAVAELCASAFGPGQSFGGAVMSSLVEKGFLVREESSFLSLFATSRWALTGEGWSAKSRIRADVSMGEEEFGRWVDERPSEAVAFIGRVGPAILLLEPIFSDLRRLSEKHAIADSGTQGGPWLVESRNAETSIAAAVAYGALSLKALGLGGRDTRWVDDLSSQI
jgi:hypothetical protein